MKWSVLIVSAEPWGDCWLSKHHYAAALAARGHRVFFLGSDDLPRDVTVPSGITLLKSPFRPKGMRYLPAAIRKKVHAHAGIQLARAAGSDFDLLWSFDYSRFYDLDVLAPRALRILHMADYTAHLPWQVAARSADLCLGCTQQMIRYLKTANANSHFLNHGYPALPAQPYAFSTPAPNVVYAGNLASALLDRHRLLGLVERYPDVHFHFFGDTGTGNLALGTGSPPWLSELRGNTNAHIHGPVPPAILPGIYQGADALLLCYDPRHGDLVANSHKVMEYLGSGRPILSTVLGEYRSRPDLIAMHDGLDDYLQALGRLLAPDSPARADEASTARREYAEAHTYERQLEKVENMLAGVVSGAGGYRAEHNDGRPLETDPPLP